MMKRYGINGEVLRLRGEDREGGPRVSLILEADKRRDGKMGENECGTEGLKKSSRGGNKGGGVKRINGRGFEDVYKGKPSQ